MAGKSPYAATRAQLIDEICARVSRGETLHRLAKQPGMPSWDTLMVWQRDDPALKARFANARAAGRGMRFQARHADRLAFPSAAAMDLLDHVRAGGRLSDRVNAGAPTRPALDAWRRINPHFAQQLAEALKANRLRAWERRRRPRPYDEAVADALALRVRAGETLRQICRERGQPHFTTVQRWRRERPDFDIAIKLHMAQGLRARRAARAGPTPALLDEMGARIAEGASLTELCASPDMPCIATLAIWRRERRAVAAAIDDALAFRNWRLLDEVACLEALGVRTRRTGALLRRAGRTGRV